MIHKFIGTTDDDWMKPQNWDTGMVPGYRDEVILDKRMMMPSNHGAFAGIVTIQNADKLMDGITYTPCIKTT